MLVWKQVNLLRVQYRPQIISNPLKDWRVSRETLTSHYRVLPYLSQKFRGRRSRMRNPEHLKELTFSLLVFQQYLQTIVRLVPSIIRLWSSVKLVVSSIIKALVP